MNLYDMLTDQEKAYHDALIDIRQKFGPLDLSTSSIWVGYETPDQNDNANIGVKCGNCSFHYDIVDQVDKLGCKLVSFNVQENGKCRLAAIPDGLVNNSNQMEEDMEDVTQKATNVSVGDHVTFAVPKPPDKTESAHGVVERVERSGKVKLPGTNETVEASSDNPVAVVIVYATNEKGKRTRTDRRVAKPVSSLRINSEPIDNEIDNKKMHHEEEMEKVSSARLQELADAYNKNKEGDSRITVGALRQVYNRGIGAYRTNPSSVRGNVASAEQWAMGRVNAFMAGLRGRFPRKPFDLDLFPKGHPRSTKKSVFDNFGKKVSGPTTLTEIFTTSKAGPCWEGYVQRGMKRGKNGKLVPNCVPDTKMNKEDSFAPNSGMKAAARRALKWKEEGKATGAGTPVGWGRATDIVAGRSMSLDTVKRMYSFFSRHEVDKRGKDFYNTSNPSNGRIMWDAWGGDAGFSWSRSIVNRYSKKDVWNNSPLSFHKFLSEE